MSILIPGRNGFYPIFLQQWLEKVDPAEPPLEVSHLFKNLMLFYFIYYYS